MPGLTLLAGLLALVGPVAALPSGTLLLHPLTLNSLNRTVLGLGHAAASAGAVGGVLAVAVVVLLVLLCAKKSRPPSPATQQSQSAMAMNPAFRKECVYIMKE